MISQYCVNSQRVGRNMKFTLALIPSKENQTLLAILPTG